MGETTSVWMILESWNGDIRVFDSWIDSPWQRTSYSDIIRAEISKRNQLPSPGSEGVAALDRQSIPLSLSCTSPLHQPSPLIYLSALHPLSVRCQSHSRESNSSISRLTAPAFRVSQLFDHLDIRFPALVSEWPRWVFPIY